MQSVFACDMSALTAEEREVHLANMRALFGAVEYVGELPGGYTFTLPATPSRLREAAEFIVLERLCCPFFDFALSLGAGSSAFELSVTGSDGTKPFIQAEFRSVLPVGMSF
jgi:hypothetical protein